MPKGDSISMMRYENQLRIYENMCLSMTLPDIYARCKRCRHFADYVANELPYLYIRKGRLRELRLLGFNLDDVHFPWPLLMIEYIVSGSVEMFEYIADFVGVKDYSEFLYDMALRGEYDLLKSIRERQVDNDLKYNLEPLIIGAIKFGYLPFFKQIVKLFDVSDNTVRHALMDSFLWAKLSIPFLKYLIMHRYLTKSRIAQFVVMSGNLEYIKLILYKGSGVLSPDLSALYKRLNIVEPRTSIGKRKGSRGSLSSLLSSSSSSTNSSTSDRETVKTISNNSTPNKYETPPLNTFNYFTNYASDNIDVIKYLISLNCGISEILCIFYNQRLFKWFISTEVCKTLDRAGKIVEYYAINHPSYIMKPEIDVIFARGLAGYLRPHLANMLQFPDIAERIITECDLMTFKAMMCTSINITTIVDLMKILIFVKKHMPQNEIVVYELLDHAIRCRDVECLDYILKNFTVDNDHVRHLCIAYGLSSRLIVGDLTVFDIIEIKKSPYRHLQLLLDQFTNVL